MTLRDGDTAASLVREQFGIRNDRKEVAGVVGRPVPERASTCGLTECQGKPMCQRCAVQAGAVLKPCPWCWTDGDALFDLWDRFDAGHIAHVHCTHCGADGPSCYSETSAGAASASRMRSRWRGSNMTTTGK